ncbi:DNA-binding MarR family transcriptional regulator [Amycolatopsis sulphurea]|uniref:DNA-binding MarR family transcriptional regulator n=1 Tax=Amycolatopsis sulphurea TaxID=76022 RepID=A0A2A9F9B1_9PSEU|nr:MarR family transcriptional regulator [Amycolatopsis sulphurea]PFG47758.1 DNA-binding MarR family transcriptional regulator [Amycolatopsis sulphurea]
MSASPPIPPPIGNAFLLAQLGAHATRRFAERVAELDLTPPQTGLLRVIARRPGESQQALAAELGTPPTRLVALVDGLEQRGLIERRRNPKDRRLYAVHLSEKGRETMRALAKAGAAHEDELTSALSTKDREVLHELLGRIAEQHGLTPGVHPGYRSLG